MNEDQAAQQLLQLVKSTHATLAAVNARPVPGAGKRTAPPVRKRIVARLAAPHPQEAAVRAAWTARQLMPKHLRDLAASAERQGLPRVVAIAACRAEYAFESEMHMHAMKQEWARVSPGLLRFYFGAGSRIERRER